jgi:carboxyl-terminal processing protease
MGQTYAGLGFLYTADPVGKRIYIDDIFPNSPAEKGGLLRFDEILAVDGKLVKDLDISKMSTIFRGQKGTKVVLTVVRKGFPAKNITFVRGMNNYKDAYCRMLDGIPYCRIYGFSPKTYKNFEESFLALPKHGKRIILDLRNNPGGWVFTATEMLGRMFVGRNFSTVFIKRKYGAQPFNDNYPTILLKDYKTVVLINRGTVSSSELFVAALKDYGLATLVGERTYGKGVSQKTTVIYGAMLSLIYAYFLSPLGHIIDKYGVKPDIEVPFYLEHLKANRDMQLEKAKELLK